MFFVLALILGALSLVMQALVVWYGLKLFRIVGHTDYWSCAWKFYIVANCMILIRRLISFVPLFGLGRTLSDRFLAYIIVEELIAVGVSILFLLFGRKLVGLFGNYIFKSNKG